MTEPVQEEQVQEQQPEEEQGPDISAALKQFDGAPSQDQIEQWKLEHDEVFVSGFSPEELYIWRPVSRPEWVDLQTLTRDPAAEIDEFKFEEMVVDMCVLWKSINKPWNKTKAGTLSSLQEQILQNSNFLTPQAASMLVIKL